MEIQTLKRLKESVDDLIKNHPEWLNLPLVYAADEEGNSYHKVYNDIFPCQVHDINAHSLEFVGCIGDEDIAIEDINCLSIN